MGLDRKKLSDLLKPKSPLASRLNRFQERKEQLEMLDCVVEAYNTKRFALIEAGTGVGKSLAYLLPALYAAHEKGETTVISTHTITLQEQLVNKDIPFILDSLGIDLEIALVKGMGNYLCLRKLDVLQDQHSSLNLSEVEDLHQIESWARETTDGSSSSLSHIPKNISWDRLNCESEACSFVKCPHYKECFFFKTRKKIKDAKILIVNHHLLMVDIQTKNQIDSKTNILPDYEHLILDEAHTLEDIATSALAQFTSAQLLYRKLNELISERGAQGKIQLLKTKLASYEEEIPPKLWEKISSDLFAEKRAVEQELSESFNALDDYLNQNFAPSYPKEDNLEKIQLTSELLADESWLQIKENFSQLIEKLKRFSTTLQLMIPELERLKKEFLKSIDNLLIDIKALALFLEKTALLLWDYFNTTPNEDKIFVIEWKMRKGHSSTSLSILHLNIADILSQKLFYPLESALLCSATLNHNQSFNFVKNRLGLTQESFGNDFFIEKILPSPFDYKSQVLLAIPKDIPDANGRDYLDAVCHVMKGAITSSQGGTFLLFTSYKMLKECYERLLPTLLDQGLLPLKQGDENRSVLLDLFKENPHSVLFGTDTFWEGIDVPGFHLRQVVMTKLPFPVPSEPLFQAKCKQIEKAGQNPFIDFSIPKAIVKFKQGFGRLIRNQEDFGCILCLDSRLLTKTYGKIFLQSLPECQTIFGSSKEVQEKIKEFFLPLLPKTKPF